MMNLKNQLVVNKELKFFESLEESENDFGVKKTNENGLSALTYWK